MDPMDPSELKATRLRLGYKTRKALAEALGVSIRAIDSWEQGWRPIPRWVPKFIILLEISKTSGMENLRRKSP